MIIKTKITNHSIFKFVYATNLQRTRARKNDRRQVISRHMINLVVIPRCIKLGWIFAGQIAVYVRITSVSGGTCPSTRHIDIIWPL